MNGFNSFFDFSHDTMQESGGVLSVPYGYYTLTLLSSEFYSNAGTTGAVIYSVRAVVRQTIKYCTFKGNTASGTGGGQGGVMYMVLGTYTNDISSSMFANNSAVQYGGVVYGSIMTRVAASTFDSNSAITDGGVFYLTALLKGVLKVNMASILDNNC